MSNGSSETTTPVLSNLHVTSSWTDHPVAITAAFAGGALLLAAGLFFAGAFESGDEPPIMVKNGSLELHLLTNREHWKEGNDAKNWSISGGPRNDDSLDIAVAVNTGGTCNSGSASGSLLTVTYSDGATVKLQSSNNHTSVVSSADLALSDKRHLLTYTTTAGAYISRITLDSVLECTFTEAKQLANLTILDY